MAHRYTQVFWITGAFLISTTDTRSETDKRALIFNQSPTWGLSVKIHKNQVFNKLCIRMSDDGGQHVSNKTPTKSINNEARQRAIT
ncbi:MAG: hypothetical protein DRR08_17390 [Candidatus Parabeggiatoa sp. nov. 2]|nr:MAG: hypothetical protein B6247_12880 [Beggiatoa sp. 4572_84]RKZ58058.1 MAG: hypothetical protein DRR08_17390 [Gammaproteobacteria bacterium]